jgi:hypothetical protein
MHGLSLCSKYFIPWDWWIKWIQKQGAYVENNVIVRHTH